MSDKQNYGQSKREGGGCGCLVLLVILVVLCNGLSDAGLEQDIGDMILSMPSCSAERQGVIFDSIVGKINDVQIPRVLKFSNAETMFGIVKGFTGKNGEYFILVYDFLGKPYGLRLISGEG